MPIEGRQEAAKGRQEAAEDRPVSEGRSLAQQRTIRYGVGTAIGLGFSQMAAWDHSYLAAVFAATFLGLPIAAPRLKGGVSFVVVLAAALLLGLLVLLPLNYQALAGVLLRLLDQGRHFGTSEVLQARRQRDHCGTGKLAQRGDDLAV